MLNKSQQQGFTLLEVMVALFVLSVGLLGVVKLEALAYSSTNIASKRSIAALEAASLAASMHVNRGYWTTPDTSGASFVVTPSALPAGQVTSTAPLLAALANTPQTCTVIGAPCAPLNMALYDLQQWAAPTGAPGTALASVSPNVVATINCGTTTPISCMINIQWAENAVNLGTQETGVLQGPSYTLYVEP
ncbi:MAG TPA: prepilin-type N-terminal cleavage/methylation domain-containing protein [Steroidobacteraceae bacterium]|jgi:type IV pilus assembly protein PilV